MYLLGAIIKKGIELNQTIADVFSSQGDEQVGQLKSLLETAKDTAFGKYYGFAQLLESEDIEQAFKTSVPIFDYHTMHDTWWVQQLKYPDISWPGSPSFFAMSSGTTGKKSKRIPVTDDFIQSMRDVGKSLIRELPNYNLPEELFTSEVLLLSSSADLNEHDEGHLEGEISGINVSNFPEWYNFFYRPGSEIAKIDDWDERLAAIVKEAPEWNIGAIAGIPSWVMLMLQAIIKEYGLETIHDIWPNFSLYASGGVAFETYRTDFDAICAKDIVIMDTYLASEGFFSYTANPGSMSMRLATSHYYYYEFIPFDERGVDDQGGLLDDPLSLRLQEVEMEQDYVLIISTCSGAWRYLIGDTIRFTSLDPYEIVITGRTKFFLNVVGSQLSEEKMDAAIVDVSEELNVTANEYAVGALQNDAGEYYHQWVVVSDDEIDSENFKNLLDENLQQANKNYKVARSKALKHMKLKVISKNVYHDYLGQKKKKGGQIKTPKVMKAERMNDFIKFIDKS